MSIRVMSYVWEHSNLGGTELLCLLAIADFADDDGVAYPSVGTIAKKVRMSERNTHYIIKRLEQSGELDVDRGAGPKGCNLFIVKGCKDCTGGANLAGASIAGGVQGFHENLAGGVQPIAPEPLYISNKDKYTHTFDQFWSAYPRKVSKGQAEKVWARLKPTADLTAQIIEAVERAKTSVQWTNEGGKYIPYPAKWLNGKGWLDELTPAQPKVRVLV